MHGCICTRKLDAERLGHWLGRFFVGPGAPGEWLLCVGSWLHSQPFEDPLLSARTRPIPPDHPDSSAIPVDIKEIHLWCRWLWEIDQIPPHGLRRLRVPTCICLRKTNPVNTV